VIIDETGEGFDSELAAYIRITQVMKERSDRATKNIVVEPVAGKVANELDYYFHELNPRPGIALVETYQTTFDTTGGWGAEYLPSDAANNAAGWVIHVHRGPGGGLTHATVKPIGNRMVRGWLAIRSWDRNEARQSICAWYQKGRHNQDACLAT
jgi:hypothetical protein